MSELFPWGAFSELPLPPFRYLPGVSSQETKRQVCESLKRVLDALGASQSKRELQFRYGCELFARGLFWEAHEVWEPLWRQSEAGSWDRAFLHALLVASAASLCGELGRSIAAGRLARRAQARFAALPICERPPNEEGWLQAFVSHVQRRLDELVRTQE